MIVRGYVRRLDRDGSCRLSYYSDGGAPVVYDGPCTLDVVQTLALAMRDGDCVECTVRDGSIVSARWTPSAAARP